MADDLDRQRRTRQARLELEKRGVILYPDHVRALPASTSGSMMLLCQTIVMAQNAVDAKEIGQLRQQRIDSTSTSLSEIEPIG